jgi:UDP-glucose 4-epimerase
MRVLVTGGAGFIGSHVANAYLEAGHEVVVVDDLSRGKKEYAPKKARLFVMDIRDKGLKTVFEKVKPEIVNHHAAQISVVNSVADPMGDAQINIMGSLNLIGLSIESGVKRFIFASTGGAIYGDQEYFPADEKHPTMPLSPYGIAKLAVEKYLYSFLQTRGLKSICLRYSNVYGPRQDPFGEGGVVAIFMEKMLNNNPITINGKGDQTRDFVYVQDVARANLKALERSAGGEINIATGREISVNDIFKSIKDITGSDVEENHGPAKAGEAFRSVLSADKAKAELGWEPEVTFEEGLKLTAEFFRSTA